MSASGQFSGMSFSKVPEASKKQKSSSSKGPSPKEDSSFLKFKNFEDTNGSPIDIVAAVAYYQFKSEQRQSLETHAKNARAYNRTKSQFNEKNTTPEAINKYMDQSKVFISQTVTEYTQGELKKGFDVIIKNLRTSVEEERYKISKLNEAITSRKNIWFIPAIIGLVVNFISFIFFPLLVYVMIELYGYEIIGHLKEKWHNEPVPEELIKPKEDIDANTTTYPKGEQ